MKNRNAFPGNTSPVQGFVMAALCAGGLIYQAPLHAQCGYTLTSAIIQPNCGLSDGMIQLFIEEGTQVYSIHWSTGDEGTMLTELSSGFYSVTVVDWDGCETTAEFLMVCDDEDVGTGTDPGGGEEEPIDTDCTLKTFTQGGWGSPAHGNNPGAYRNEHFAAAFPNGLTIGCTRTLTLTTAAAVQAFLPSGSQPRMLDPGSKVDPTSRQYKNVLAGQLVAATLNVGMDAFDAGFAPSNNLLGNAWITSGPFTGISVQQLLDMANTFIGGCGGPHSPSELNDALSAINENFVDGTTDNGFLSCGTGTPRSLSSAFPATQTAYPNPASSALTVQLEFSKPGTVRIELIDVMGRVLAPHNMTASNAGTLVHTMDVSSLRNGLYFVRTTSGDQERISRVVVAR